MKINLETESGFTLIELLVGVLVLSIITLGIASMLNISFRSHQFASEQLDAVREARQCLPKIIDEIKYCSSISSISEDASTIYYLDADGVNSSIYRDSGTGLVRVEKNSIARDLITVKVDKLVFTKNDQNGLTIKIQLDINKQSLITTVRAQNFTS